MRLLARLFFISVLCCFLTSCGEKVEKIRTVGYKGEARSNAFLAAQRLLEGRGHEVEVRTGMGQLDWETSVIFLAPSTINTTGRVNRVLEWVRDGGHLVLMMQNAQKTGNDFTPNTLFWWFDEEISAPIEKLLSELDVEAVWHEDSSDHLSIDEWEELSESERALRNKKFAKISPLGEERILRHDNGWKFKYDKKEHPIYEEFKSTDPDGDEDGVSYLSIVRGEGRVTLMSDASPIRNRFISYADHAQFLDELVMYGYDTNRIVFASGAGEGFFSLLWRHFKMMVIALLVVVALWLWKSLPRFGPVQDTPDGNLREFSQQLRGVGRFLWKHKRQDAMIGSLRRAVLHKSGISADGEHEVFYQELSEDTGLSVEQVSDALTQEVSHEPGAMVRTMRHLQKIYQSTK